MRFTIKDNFPKNPSDWFGIFCVLCGISVTILIIERFLNFFVVIFAVLILSCFYVWFREQIKQGKNLKFVLTHQPFTTVYLLAVVAIFWIITSFLIASVPSLRKS